MSGYTPDTWIVRLTYAEQLCRDIEITWDEALEAFDNWFTRVERAAAEKAWDEAVRYLAPDDVEIMWAVNPYRAEAYRQERREQ